VFENRTLKRIFGHRRNIKENDENFIMNFTICISYQICYVGRIRWVEYIACMKVTRNAHKI
jgi:hypothetical protein